MLRIKVSSFQWIGLYTGGKVRAQRPQTHWDLVINFLSEIHWIWKFTITIPGTCWYFLGFVQWSPECRRRRPKRPLENNKSTLQPQCQSKLLCKYPLCSFLESFGQFASSCASSLWWLARLLSELIFTRILLVTTYSTFYFKII